MKITRAARAARATRATRATRAAVLVAALALTATACGDDDKAKAGDVVSNATKKAGEAAASATAKAGEAGEKAKEAYASASASASAKFAEIKDGADAKDEVKAGAVKAAGDRSTAEVTATNKQDKEKTYTVQVDFRDGDGNRLDTVVVNVKDVAAGKNATATARSNRTLNGDVKAEIAKAVRH
ncbi:FxLYD domain-containing protein [Streptomyces sp. NPDC091272]|uniref:FxLYD domain-containing protein n=1 Tax=Streptomyces sp. NPDC091272 TaxID=3365981 RepID=UPI003820BD8F